MTFISSCEGCIYYQQEIQKREEEYKLNFVTLKKKIISTDRIIRKYHGKCQELECLKQKLIAVTKQSEQAQTNLFDNDMELRKVSHNLEQMEKKYIKLEEEIKEIQNEKQTFLEQLLAAQHSEEQYKAKIDELEILKEEEQKKRLELQRRCHHCTGKNENKEFLKQDNEEFQDFKNLKSKLNVAKEIIDRFSKTLEKIGFIAKHGNRKLKKYFGRNSLIDGQLLLLENGNYQNVADTLLQSVDYHSDEDLNDKDAEKLELLLIETSGADRKKKNKKEAARRCKMAAKQKSDISSKTESDNKIEGTHISSDNSSSILKNDQNETLNHHSNSRPSHNFESVLNKIRRFSLNVDSVLSPLPPSPYHNDEDSDADDLLQNSEEKGIKNISENQYMDENIFESVHLAHHQVQHQLSEGFSVDMEAYEHENVVNEENISKPSLEFVELNEDNKSLQPVASSPPHKSTNEFRKLKRLKKIDDYVKTEMPVVSDTTSFTDTVLIKTEHQDKNMFISEASCKSKPIVKALSTEIYCIDILDEHNYSATDNDLNNSIESECRTLLQTLISKICETVEDINSRGTVKPLSSKPLISDNVKKDSKELMAPSALDEIVKETESRGTVKPLSSKPLISDNVKKDSKELMAPSALDEIVKETESKANAIPDIVVAKTMIETKDNVQVNDFVSKEAKLSNNLSSREISLTEEKNEKGTIIENDHNKKVSTNEGRFKVTPDKFIENSSLFEATVLPSEKHSPTSSEVLQNIHFTPSSVHRNSEKTCSENEVCTLSDSSSFSPPLIIKPLSPLKSPSEQKLIISSKAELSLQTLQSSEQKTTSQAELTVISVSPSAVESPVNDESRNTPSLNRTLSFSVDNIKKPVDVKNTASKRKTPSNDSVNKKTSCSINKQINISSEIICSSTKEIIHNKDLITQSSLKFNKETAGKSFGTTNGNSINKSKRCLGNDLLNVAKHFKADVSKKNTKSSDKVNEDIPGNLGKCDTLQLNSELYKTCTDDPSGKDLFKTQNEKISLKNDAVSENVDEIPEYCDPSPTISVEFTSPPQNITMQKGLVFVSKKWQPVDPSKTKVSVSFNFNSEQTNKDNSKVNKVLNKDMIKKSKPDNSGTCQQTGKKLKKMKKAIITILNHVNNMKVDASLEDWKNVIDNLCDCIGSRTSNFLARRMMNQLKTVDTDLIKDILTAACNNQFPPLTAIEQKYVYLATSMINKYQLTDLFIDFTSIVNEVFFISKENLQVFSKATLCRFYAALCRLQGNLEIARVFCYDLFRNLHSDAGIYVASVIGVWPSVVIMPPGVDSSLCQTFQFLLLKKSNIIKLPAIHHLIKSVCHTSEPSYGTEIFANMLLDKLGHIEDTETAKEVFHSLELIAAIEGWQWTNDILIRQKLWPLLQKWSVESTQESKPAKKNNESNEDSRDKIASLILQFLGTVCQLCPQNDKDAVLQTVQMLINLLQMADETDVPICVQEATFESLLQLVAYDHSHIIEVLTNWPGKKFLSLKMKTLFDSFIEKQLEV